MKKLNLKHEIDGAVRDAKAKTRGGSQVGSATAGNLVKCLFKRLAKYPASQVLGKLENYK